MIPQTAQQQILSSARGVEVVYIVEMLLYSDAAGLTIAQRLRFSTVALTGFTDAEDGVTLDCLTYLSSIPRVPEDRMFHFPSQDELVESSLRKAMVFDLVNALWGTGVRLSTFLEGLNVNFARVKMMKLYLPLGTMNAHKRRAIDVSGFESGSERVLFRGEVGTPSYGEEVLSFAATTRPIESQALILNDSSFLASALGQRVAQPYGSGVIVRAERLKNPLGALLAQRINNATVTGLFDVDDDSQLPTSGTYFVSINNEDTVECVGIAASLRISIVTRGNNATSHEIGAGIILEGAAATVDPIWVVASFEIADVVEVKLGTSFDDAVQIQPADFTVVNPDTVTVPGATTVTISITTSKLQDLFPDDPLGVSLFARLDGRIVPFEIASAYAFDDDANWNDDPPGVHSSFSPAGGRHYQSVETPYDQNAVNTETAAGWGTQNCLVTTSTTRIQGSRSVEFRRDAGGLNIYGGDRAVSLPFPNTTSPGPLFICNVRLDHPGGLGDVVSVAVVIGNSAGVNDIFGFTVDNFSNRTWKTIICERGRQTGTAGGGMVGATITYMQVFVSSGFVGQGFQLDKIQTVDTTDMVAQKNDLANLDMSSAGPYQAFAKALRPEWIDKLTVTISDDTLGGTTDPTNFLEIELTGLTSVWDQYRETATTGGAPTPTAIESIRFEVTLKGTNVYQEVVSHTGQLWAAGASIDQLGRAVNPGTPYVGGLPGQTITHPADVIRLHLQENGGIPEAEIDLDGLADIVASIGSGAAWAFNMSTLGFSFEAILLRLCYEAGVNVITAEEVDRQLFRLLIGNGAVADYGFDAPGQTIDVTDYRVQQIHPRSREVLFTDYLMLFRLESALESVDDTSFANVIQASVRRNDIAAFVSTDRFTAAEERYGKRVLQGPIYSLCIADPATAQERLGREVTYRMDERPLLRLNVESWVGASLELGDIVTVFDRMAALVDGTPLERKMRVLAISQSDLGTPTTLIEVD